MGPGTHKGPTAHPHHPVPLHLGGRRPTTRRWHGEREGGAGGEATCSGTGLGWGWMGPCGCQVPDHPKTVRDRATIHGVSISKPAFYTLSVWQADEDEILPIPRREKMSLLCCSSHSFTLSLFHAHLAQSCLPGTGSQHFFPAKSPLRSPCFQV